jgi:hypothetical protein
MIDTHKAQPLIDELQQLMTTAALLSVGLGSDSPDKTNPKHAALSRTLLRARDLADLLAGELSVLYWGFKGSPDPREET